MISALGWSPKHSGESTSGSVSINPRYSSRFLHFGILYPKGKREKMFYKFDSGISENTHKKTLMEIVHDNGKSQIWASII